MPFENFYKESDKTDRRWRWLVCAVLLSPIVYVIVLVSFSWYENREAEIEFERQAARARNVDALCTSLPKPEQFSFVRREPPSSSGYIASIIFRYRSERKFEEIMPTFRVWFDNNGWTADKGWNAKFDKGNQSILIQPSESFYLGNFEIWCYERAPGSLSFEIYD